MIQKCSGKRSRGQIYNLRPAVLLNESIDPELLYDGTLYDSLMEEVGGSDLLLIVGTSLKTDSAFNLVRDLAETVHNSEGAVVLIDTAELKKGRLAQLVDFHLQMDAQVCAEAILSTIKKVCILPCNVVTGADPVVRG